MQFLTFEARLCLAFVLSTSLYFGSAPMQAKQVQLPNLKRFVEIGIRDDIANRVQRVGERIDTLYPLLPPKLGVYLTNPNVVLLLADERGLADVVFDNWKPDDAVAIAKFNQLANKSGFRIGYKKDEAETAASRDRRVDGWFENLAGYEWVSNHTTLPGVLKYSATTGWKGLGEWKAKSIDAMEKHIDVYQATSTQATSTRAEVWHNNSTSRMTPFLNGLAFGYPDTAILIKEGKWTGTLIPYSDFHVGNQPNYDYQCAGDLKAINLNVKRLGTLLGEYYHSPQYIKLEQDPDFAKARAIADNYGRE